MTVIIKKHNTIGCCGIDCGLCPRFNSKSVSACPGCGGMNFKEKHPSCVFVTCCVIKNGLEVCSICTGYPCHRFDPERYGMDSFVTHQKVFANLEFIKRTGIDCFIDQQKIRMNILNDFLASYNDGRSMSHFCLSCTLLPLEKLLEIQRYINNRTDLIEIREKNLLLKECLKEAAEGLKINITLKTKKSIG
jgi:hypothetical protein